MKKYSYTTDINYIDEQAAFYNDIENNRRKDFFAALNKEDDGRLSPVMTDKEFASFKENHILKNDHAPKGTRCVEIYFRFLAYQDVSYVYCFDDDCVYKTESNIGD